MGRRLGRGRLYQSSIEGVPQTQTVGPAMSGAIGTQGVTRDMNLITTEITIDLANAAGACSSFATTLSGARAKAIVGLSSSGGTGAATQGNAQIMQIDAAGTIGTGNGVITSAEMLCVETPTGGGVHLGLWIADNLSGSGADMQGGNAAALIDAANQQIGTKGTGTTGGAVDNKYLYLIHSGSGAAVYTAGKFVIRLYGYNVFDDV